MSKIITYQNDTNGKFCQIQLSDGNKILISIAEKEIKISKLVLGIIPTSVIFKLSIFDLLSGKYSKTNDKLITESGKFDLLDGIKEQLLKCNSLSEVTDTLDKIFVTQQAISQNVTKEKETYILNLNKVNMNLLEKIAVLEGHSIDQILDEVIEEYVDDEKLTTYPNPKIEDVTSDLKNIESVSISYLQRKYGIRYYHAERILNELTDKGVIESGKDNKPRKVKN